jgi:hypothetical protein
VASFATRARREAPIYAAMVEPLQETSVELSGGAWHAGVAGVRYKLHRGRELA